MKTFPHVRTYRRYAFLYTVDIVVEWFAAIALMALVYDRTGSTTAVAMLLVAKQVVPGALVPVVGGRLEGQRPGRVLVGSFLLQAACLGGLALPGSDAAFLVLAGVSGLAGGIVRSSIRAAMARQLDDEQLAAGNSFLNISIGVAGVVGPILAAAAVSIAGASAALVVAALLLLSLVSCVPGLNVGGADAPRSPAADSGSAEVSTQNAHPALPLTGVLVLVAAVMAAFSMDDPALLDFSERALRAGIGGYATITLVWGLGITLGGLLFTRLTELPLLRIYVGATLLAAVGYIGLGMAPTIEVAIAFALIGGLGNGMDWVAVVTLVQQSAPKGRETWAATRLEAIATAAPGLGILAGGVLADAASSRVALVAPGILAIAAIAIAGLVLRLRARQPAPMVAERSLTPSIHGGSA